MKRYLRKIKQKLEYQLFFLATKKPEFSSLYYALSSNDFNREHFAVVHGQMRYQKEEWQESSNHYLLRRNIHRLEKGLLMKPRRKVFGLDYIHETVECYCKILAKIEPVCLDEIEWAYDVLSEYFRVVDQHEVINSAKSIFLSKDPLEGRDFKKIPYKRLQNELSDVCFEDFLELAKQRRSVRWYLQKSVPRELIDKAILAASLSPSACNRQPFELRIFDDPDLVGKISELPLGTKGFNHNFPTIVAVVGKLRAYSLARDRHIIYIDGSLASMSFMFALETLGLSSCPINWPDIDHLERKMSDLLQLEIDERVIMLISVGYPDPEGEIAFSQKKTLDEIRRFNFE